MRLYWCCSSLVFNRYWVCISVGTWTIQISSPFSSVLPGKCRIITQLRTDRFLPYPFQSTVHRPTFLLTPSSLSSWQCCRHTTTHLKRNQQSRAGTSAWVCGLEDQRNAVRFLLKTKNFFQRTHTVFGARLSSCVLDRGSVLPGLRRSEYKTVQASLLVLMLRIRIIVTPLQGVVFN